MDNERWEDEYDSPDDSPQPINFELYGEFIEKPLSEEYEHICSFDEVFKNIFHGYNHLIAIHGKKEDRKNEMMMELIAQNLINAPESEVLYFNTSGKFDIVMFEEACMSVIPFNLHADRIPSIMDRLLVIDILSSKQLHHYLKCMETLNEQITNLSMIVIDDLPFYTYDSFVYNKIVGGALTRRQYISAFNDFLFKFSKVYEVAILYLLPENLLELDYETNHEMEWQTYNRMRKEMSMNPIPRDQLHFLCPRVDGANEFSEEKKRKFFPKERNGRIYDQPDLTISLNQLGSSNMYTMQVEKNNNDDYAISLTFKMKNGAIEWLEE